MSGHAIVALVTDGGEAIGISVRGIGECSIYAKCGFRNGDIWQEVNGVTINSPESALAAYPAWRTAETIRIVALRDGEPVRFQIDFFK